jgi:hypothetical protein
VSWQWSTFVALSRTPVVVDGVIEAAGWRLDGSELAKTS